MAANMTYHSWSTRLAFVIAILVAAGSCSHRMVEGLRVGNPSSSIGTMTNIHHDSVARQERVTLPPFTTSAMRRNSMVLQMAKSSSSSNASREDEIRRKIMELKQEGKLQSKDKDPPSSSSSSTSANLDFKKRSVADEYAEKLSDKLGGRKTRMMSKVLTNVDLSYSAMSNAKKSRKEKKEEEGKRKAKLGALDPMDDDYYDDDDDDFSEIEDLKKELTEMNSEAASDIIEMLRRNIDTEEDEEEEMDEDEMVDIVAKALYENGGFISRRAVPVEEDEEEETTASTTATSAVVDTPNVAAAPRASTEATTKSTTSGVGGSWTPPPDTEEYQPKVGTWGAFPRPKNISVAYGGGKRIGAEVQTDSQKREQSIQSTKDKLASYRQKMGIEVQSEKDNADVIEDALALAGRAMQRGSYSTGVSCLEKVTQYCSTKSKLGGRVFLELAMAYEAEGQTDKAISLYAALSKSPIETIKMNADRLLYGLEAMNFMRNEAKLKEFSKKKVVDTFVDATGFADITKNFDNVYNTAYVDLDKGSQYYRMLTENVVRSTREARQILLKAVSPGEVERMKIVQALRSISRHFDDALTAEKDQEKSKNIPLDYAGRPIMSARRSSSEADLSKAIGMDGFILMDAPQTLANLDGEWRLQLMADRKGDGVNFFNTTQIWQAINTSEMTFRSDTTIKSLSGDLVFNGKERVLSRQEVSSSGGGIFSIIFGGGKTGTAGEMTNVPLQILSVDSVLLVTRAIVKAQAADNVEDYFSVWRRAEPGTFSSRK